jgi:RHS repeat-associated protein
MLDLLLHKHFLCLAVKRLFGSTFILIVVFTGLAAQTTSTTDGTTPSGIAPGLASGSYALSGLDNVNLYNGNLNFALPLLRIGGRGTAGYEMTLPLNVKSWHVQKIYDRIHDAYKYRPNQNQWVVGAGISPGALTGRQLGLDYQPTSCFGGNQHPDYPTKSITTLTFVSPGETEHELRDVNTNGQPLPRVSCFVGASRGTVFATTDGSSVTFVSDTVITDQIITTAQTFYPSGYLLFPNGTRYRIDSGRVSWIRDRNGNQVTFTDNSNGSRTITDSRGRQITLTPGGSDPAYYTDISYNGFGGAQRTIRVTGTALSNALRQGSSIQTFGQLFPELFSSGPPDSFATLTNNPNVVSSVTLPDGRQYQFLYNSYGEIARVTLPTGGAIEYDMVAGSGVFYYSGTDDNEIYRRVAERRVYPDGGTGSSFESRTTFAASTNSPFDPKPWYTNVTVDQLNQSGTLLAREKHYFTGSGLASLFKFFTGVSSSEFYSPWSDGKEYQTEAIETANCTPSTCATVLRRTVNVWQQGCPVGPLWNNTVANNPRVGEMQTTLVETNQVAKQVFSYDCYNNRTDVYEYDFGAGTPGGLLRHTHTDYLTATNYTDALSGAHLRSLPTGSQIYAVNPANGAETLAAQSTITYDEPAYPLLTYGSLTGWVDPGTAARGNVTTAGKWLDTTGAYLQTHAQYDQAGSLRNAWDAMGNQSQVEYSSAYAYAYPTLTRTAVPDPSGAYASTASLVATSLYDFDTGLVSSTTDANGQTTSFEHTDLLDRLTRVNLPDGGRTTYIYVDAHQCGPYVEARTLLDSSGRESDSYQFFDGLGRPYRAFSYENQDTSNPYLTVDTQYDAMGRAWRVSNPYRSAGCTAAVNPSGRWTQTAFDALSRPTQITTADGAAVTTAYSGNTVTVTDQAGKKRRSVTDALGRLARIDEPDSNGNLGLVSAPAQPTSYNYDALGNLRKVDQGGQQRFFMYDSLSRLIRAKNPEQAAGSGASNMTDAVTGNTQWSMAYGYDNNGNLTARVDARNITTNYGYDALNRNFSVTYSDGTTPAVYRYYDSATNGRGRLYWDQAVGFSANVFDAYDAMGRPTQYHQRFWVNGAWGNYFNIARTYDKAGHVLTQTNPSGRTVNSGYDIAGRINSDTGNLGDGVTRTYATAVTYSEFGGLQQEQFGTQTPLYHKLHYNVRGQLNDIRLSTVAWATDQWNWNRGAIVNYYATADLTCQTNECRANSGTNNNGNAIQSQHWIPANDQMSSYNWTEDRCAYDSLNRLKSVAEYHGSSTAGLSGQDYTQVYNYDRWGNRTIDQNLTSANVPHPNYTADATTNRLIAPAGYTYSYDAAGNLTSDNYTGQGARTYDAENRMKQAQGSPNNQWQTYTYDADGRRIKRNVNGVETWQVYGLDGELLAEYQAGAAPFLPTTEYGYRGGELLVTIANGDTQRLTRFVTNLYYGAKQRDPTTPELQDATSQLAAAGAQSQAQLLTTATQIARSLFTSTNYETSPYRSDVQYVADLYYAYLQRGPDDSGLNFWAGQAASSRANVCNAFEASGEFQTLVATLYGTSTSDNQRTEQFVNNFYLGAYGRNATATELQQQRDALNAAAAQSQASVQTQAETMGRALFAAQVNDASLSNTQYVTNLYEAFLQRGPDAGGLGWWSGQASVGQGRQNVLNAFATCGAFRELAGTLYREANWLVADQLGTPRMIVNKSGALSGVKSHDYLPFGEELSAGTGGRTWGQGYTGDSVRQKFTQQERDSETGLDYMHARYFASAQGRFISADTFAGFKSNPQTLNLYAYVQNNPLTFSDPTGHISDDHGLFGALSNPWSEIPWTVAGQQQQSPAAVPYVGDGIVKSGAGETPADEGILAPENPINMSVTIAQEPHIEQNLKLGDKTLTGVGAQLEIGLTDKSGNPLSGPMTESNKEGGVQNPNAVPLTQGYFKDWVGKFGDASTMPGTVADLKAYVTTTPITVTSHQTLTVSSGKSSYQVTWTRTLSNVDASGKLNTTFNSHGMNFAIKWTAPVIRQISP